MITVYHLTRSRSERIVWLLEELGIDYRIEVFRREANNAAPAAMKAIHAIGKAPIIRDGDVVLAESGAIVEYIVNRHAGGRLGISPSDARYARYIYWIHFAEGSLMSLMVVALVLTRIPNGDKTPAGVRVLARMKYMLSFVDAELADGPYFVGAEFTAADVMMTFTFTTMRYFLDYDLASYPHIVAYLKRIEARPAYQKAMELAGPKVGT